MRSLEYLHHTSEYIYNCVQVMGNTGITQTVESKMRTATSKLTKKYQASIPEPVRQLLHLDAGDEIAFVIEDDDVHLRKARPVDLAFAQSIEGTLNEWMSAADEEAYRDL
jgi:antitoxin PrlF